MKCLYYDGVQCLSSYQEVGWHAFGRAGLIIVWFFYATTMIGVAVMFLILAGMGLKTVFTHDISIKVWIWICTTIVVIPFVLMKTLKEVTITSICGTLATLVLVIVVVHGAILDMHNPIYDDVNHSVIILSHLPTTVASILMCFGGNVIYIHVEESMQYPRSWNHIVATALGTCSILYLATAIFGYMAYGDHAESPILNNLPKDMFTKVRTVIIIIHVIFTTPIPLMSLALEIECLLNITMDCHGTVMEQVYCTVFCIIIIGVCGCITCTVPYFRDFLSLLGALSNCTLIFILPILCYIKLFGWRCLWWYELIWCILIVIIGIVSVIIGSIDVVIALRDDFENNPSN